MAVRLPGVPARHAPRTRPSAVSLLIWAFVALAALGGCQGGRSAAHGTMPATGTEGETALLTEVRGELAAMRQTSYRHATEVDAALGQFHYDCSGFLDYALGKVRPADLTVLPVSGSAGRPLAEDFEHYLRWATDVRSAGPWRGVASVPELRPGDVIAWLAAPDAKTRDTGHVMVVLDTPVSNSTRTGQWLVRVADSTVSPHARDSRADGAEGLGAGTIGLDVDSSARPVGFYWRGGESKAAKHTEVALGRPG